MLRGRGNGEGKVQIQSAMCLSSFACAPQAVNRVNLVYIGAPLMNEVELCIALQHEFSIRTRWP
jgi:hypothetical protein